MKKQITFLLFTLLFALTSSQVMAQQDVLYLIQDGTNDTDYISNGGSLPGQDQIIKMLEADANFTVSWVKINANFEVTEMGTQAAGANALLSVVDFTDFELVIVSENIASNNNIFKVGNKLHPDQLTIPVIYAKPYAFRGSSAALATSASVVIRTQELSMTVENATSPIFNGLTVSNGSSVDLFRTTADDKGNDGALSIDIVTGLEISASTTLLASVPQITDVATAIGINYFPSGTKVGTTDDGIFAQDAISLPFIWGAWVKKDGGNITSEFLTIWRNAAYMLTGQTPPSTLYVNPVYDDYEIVTETVVYDFRDGSIIPNHTDGYEITGSPEALAAPQTDRLKSADAAIDYRHIAGDNYHGATYGLNMKAGSRVFVKPIGTRTATVKVPLSEFSSLGLELKLPNNNNKAFIKVNGANTSADGASYTYQQTLNAIATTGNDLNEFITIEYYPKGGQSLEFMADGTGGGTDIYLPYIEVTYQSLQALPKQVAYVQKSGFTSGTGASASTNDPIIRMLDADPNFVVTVIETDAAGTGLDLTGYDLVVAQETFSSGDGIWSGAFDVQTNTVPIIFNKTWAWQANKNHIASAAAGMGLSTEKSISIDPSNQDNTLFNGIDFTGGNEIILYNELAPNNGGNDVTGTNAIDILQNIEIGVSGTNLATVADVTTSPDTSILVNEIPQGTQIGTLAADMLKAPMIAFAFNYGAIIKNDGANISPEALTIWRNAAYKLTGLTVPNTLVANPDFTLGIDKVGEVSAVTSNVRAIGNRIYVSNVKSATEVNIYSITGALVKSFKTNTDTDFNFKTGIWIATVKTFEGAKAVKLLTR